MRKRMEVRLSYYSLSSNPWTDVSRVARKILNDGLYCRTEVRNPDERRDEREILQNLTDARAER